MTTVTDLFGLNVHPDALTRRFTCGVEYEIESIQEHDLCDFPITIEKDNSLRNNGLEFKTTPMSFSDAVQLFLDLHNNIKLGADPYTDRTSIHVHVNCSQLSAVEVRQFVLTYALFEPLFFKFVGPVRQGSIFCVPLSYTYIPSNYKRDIIGLHSTWQKYTAFNICPLGPGKDGTEPLGTIEFRHLYGTGDVQVFTTWLSAIKELYDFIERTPNFDIVKNLDQTAYGLLTQIIPTFAKIYDPYEVNALCENSVLDVKLSVGGLSK